MLPYLRHHFGNPSSDHVYGQRAREAVDQARGQIADLIGCRSDEILFTSGGTEANNLAIRGVAEARWERRHIVTSRIEHPATQQPCQRLESLGWSVSWAPVDSTGRVRVEEVAEALSERTALVTIMHANNEVGTLQPLGDIAPYARQRGVLLHADAAQSVGKVAVKVNELGVDLLSIAGHKLHAPKGIGALYVRRGAPRVPVLLGAAHEGGLRPGTENVASIVGLGRACEIAKATLETEATRIRGIRDLLWDRLRDAIPGIALNGHPTERLPNTLNVRFPGVRGSTVLAQTPQIAASVGAACHEGTERPSGVLTAMGLREEEALGAVRLSLGRENTPEEIARAAEALTAGWRRAMAEPI
jgi:cysteine desulfurase